jgi:hypothetical protein
VLDAIISQNYCVKRHTLPSLKNGWEQLSPLPAELAPGSVAQGKPSKDDGLESAAAIAIHSPQRSG